MHLSTLDDDTALTRQSRQAAYLTVEHVGKAYDSERGPIEALSDISLAVMEGEFVSIVGASGCGKSTLLKCIAGLEPVSSGAIQVDAKPVVAPPDSLGMVFQRDLLLDWRTVLDNILITIEFQRGRRKDFVDKAHGPGRIVADMTIDLPRDRPLSIRDTAAFGRLSGAIRETIGRRG